MGTIAVENVIDYGVDNSGGGDPTTNTEGIQRALDEAESNGGGIVYFPVGKYLINETLKLPSKVKILGEGGTTFGFLQHEIGTSNFLNFPSTIIIMDDDSNVSMFEPKGLPPIQYGANNNVLYQAGIENLILFGNKENQTRGDGIHLSDITNNSYSTRGHVRFRNILIYQFYGNGFYGGIGHHELYFDEVVVFGCDSDGCVLYGQDIKANRLQSADNGGTGIKIIGKKDDTKPDLHASGAVRFYDIDCWSNAKGIEIIDTMNVFFYGLGCNLNTIGVHIHPGLTQDAWSPFQIHFFRANFDANSECDVKVSSSAPNLGSANILFESCLFRGKEVAPPQTPPDYAIVDESYIPARNIVSNCFFRRDLYGIGIINNNGIYAFRNCFDYNSRRVLDEITVPYSYVDYDYTILPTDGYITVGTATGNITITLPKLSDTQVGKVLFLSKVDSHSNSVTIIPDTWTNDIIQGATTINQQFETLMVVNAGAAWYSVKIS
jgi:hypothetical protein